MSDLELSCRCGTLRGVVRDLGPDVANRLICYCDDCRAWMKHLQADDLLDAHGGSEIVQVSVARVELTDGLENLAAGKLTPKGMIRWYAACCRTPLANTPANQVPPFAGLARAALQGDVEAAVGPVLCGVHGRLATGDPSTLEAHPRAPVRFILRTMRLMGGWWWAGDGVRSPFFRDGRPRVEPVPLTAARRAELG